VSPRRREPDRWPWPADTPLDRARRVAGAYRDALLEADPAGCAALDERAVALGQGWVVPQPATVALDDLLTAEQAAVYAQVGVRTLDEWRRRGLVAVTTADGVRYRPRDLHEFEANRRARRVAGTRTG
jgi:hypothetical protein